ncbi:MAG: DUF547 domain-containing protein [Candidatus Rokubacteria bacterium]|nr:DUF547 domain-containing protein [Candidatus Rokubacteria bacterium]
MIRGAVLNDVGECPPPELDGVAIAEMLARTMVHGATTAGSAGFVDAARWAACLRSVDPFGIERREHRLAFWINVYNALARHGLAALAVRRTVWEVWNFFGRVRYRVGGYTFSLDDIEHGVLRGNRARRLPPWPAFRRGDRRAVLAVVPPDPRIHFALNCGARSCPPLAVYRAEQVDRQLDLATRSFLAQEVALEGDRIVCSKLLKWYRADFAGPGGLASFLLDHLDDGPARRALAAGAPPCAAFRPYSWTVGAGARR